MTLRDRDSSVTSGAKAVAQVATISMVAGVVILLQDAVIAARFGASDSVDAYQLAMSFPIMALNVFAGGTLLAVMVPRLVQLDVAGRTSEAAALVRQVRRAVAWLLLGVSGAWAAAYPYIVRSIADELSPATIDLSTRLLWLGLPALVFSGLSSVEGAVLNSRRRFGLLSALPAFMPAGVALGVLLLGSRLDIFAASIGALGGSAAQLVASRRRTAALLGGSEDRNEPPPALILFVRAYGASVAAAALLGGIFMSDTFMASTLPPGSTATLGYATRPVILLLAFATAAVGNVTLPMFSRLAAANDLRRLKLRFASICGLLALAAVPIVVMVCAYAPFFVALLYERGTFGAADTARVAAVQQVYVLHVPCFVVAVMGWRVMNSLQRHRALLAITAVAFAVNLTTDLWLAPRMGLVGIAWGTNAAFTGWAMLIVLYLYNAKPETSRA